MTKPCHRALEQLFEGQNVQRFMHTHLNPQRGRKSHWGTHSGYEHT